MQHLTTNNIKIVKHMTKHNIKYLKTTDNIFPKTQDKTPSNKQGQMNFVLKQLDLFPELHLPKIRVCDETKGIFYIYKSSPFALLVVKQANANVRIHDKTKVTMCEFDALCELRGLCCRTCLFFLLFDARTK